MQEPGMREVTPPTEPLEQSPKYKDLLVNATFDPNRAIDERTTSVNLGSLEETRNELLRDSKGDPQRQEHGKVCYVLPDGKVIIETKTHVGEHLAVVTPIDVRLTPDQSPTAIILGEHNQFIPKRERGQRFVGAVIHTHPADILPSPEDLAPLLLADAVPMAYTSVFVITPDRTIIVFRGKSTPQLTPEEVESKKGLWSRQVTERMEHVITPAMNVAEGFDAAVRMNRAMTRQILAKYDLRTFSCSNKESTLQLTPPQSIL